MRTQLFVYCLCYLTNAVSQQQTGKSNETKLFRKQPKVISRDMENMSQTNNEVNETGISNLNWTHRQSYEPPHSPIVAWKQFSMRKQNSSAKTSLNYVPKPDGLNVSDSHFADTQKYKNFQTELKNVAKNALRLKVNAGNGRLGQSRKKKSHGSSRSEYQSMQESQGISSAPVRDSGISETLEQLVLEMKKLHKQQELDRQSQQSLQQQIRSKLSPIKTADEKIEETNKQVRGIQLALRSFDTEAKITRKEISAIKNNQQRFLQRLETLSRSNTNLVDKVHRISDSCKRGLFSLAQSNDSESKVLNMPIKVAEKESEKIKDDIRNLKENIQAAYLMIEIQVNVSAVLESKINKALEGLHGVQGNISEMRDFVTLGQSVRATEIPTGSNSPEMRDFVMLAQSVRATEIPTGSNSPEMEDFVTLAQSVRATEISTGSNSPEMRDFVTLGQNVRATEIPTSSNSPERKVSLNRSSEFNGMSDHKQHSEARRSSERKSRKSRHVSSLALIMQTSERNVEDTSRNAEDTSRNVEDTSRNVGDTSKQNHEEMPPQANNARDRTVQAYGVLGPRFGANGNTKINIIDDTQSETSLLQPGAGSLGEPELILLYREIQGLPSPCCSPSDEQLQVRTTVVELQSASLTSSGASTSIDSSWPGLPYSSLDGQLSNMFVSSTNTHISDMAPMHNLHKVESSQLFHMTKASEHFLLSNSFSVLQHKEEVPLAIPSMSLSIQSTAILSSTLSHASFIPESLHVDLPRIERKDDQGLRVIHLDSSSYWLELSSREIGTVLTSLVELAVDGTPSVNLIATEDFDSKWQGSSEETSPHVSASKTPSDSKEAVLGTKFNDYNTLFARSESTISSVSTWQSPENISSPSPESNNKPSMPVSQTLLGWEAPTSSPVITSYTSHLSPIKSKMSSLSSSLSSQTEPLAHVDQKDFSSFASVEIESYIITPVAGLSHIKPSSLRDAMSIGGEEITYLTNSLSSPRAEQSVDFPNYPQIDPLSVTHKASEFYHSATPVLDPSDTEQSPLTGKLQDLKHIRAGRDGNATTNSRFAHTMSSEDPPNHDQTKSNSDSLVDMATPTIDRSDVQPTPPAEQLLDVIPFGAKENENVISTFSYLAQSHFEDTAILDQIHSSSRTFDTVKRNTNSVIYWADIESSLFTEEQQDKMSNGSVESINIINSTQASYLAQSVDPTDLEHLKPSSHALDNIKAITASHVTDGSATGSLFPTENLSDLESTLGQYTQRSASAQSDYHIHLDERSFRSAISIASQSAIALSGSDQRSVEDSLQGVTSTKVETYINIASSRSDFWSQKFSPGTYSGEMQTRRAMGAVPEIYTSTPVMDWSEDVSSPPLWHLRDDLSTRTEAGDTKVSSLSKSHFEELEFVVNTDQASFHFVTSTTPEMYRVESVMTEISSVSSELPVISNVASIMLEVSNVIPVTHEMSSVTSVTLEMFSATAVTTEISNVVFVISKMPSMTSVIPEISSMTSVIPEISSVIPVITEKPRATPFIPEMPNVAPAIPRMTSVTFIKPEMTSVTSVTLEMPSMFLKSEMPKATSAIPKILGVTSDIDVITRLELEPPSPKGNPPDLMSTTVEDIRVSATHPHSMHLNYTNTGDDTPGASNSNITREVGNLPSLYPSDNTPVTFERERVMVAGANQSEQIESENDSSHKQIHDVEQTGYTRHLEDRLTALEKTIVQLTSARMLPSQEVNSFMLNRSTDLQMELEAYIQNRTLDLLQQLSRDTLLTQQDELKRELEKQQLYIQNQTHDMVMELEGQRNKTDELKKELEKQKAYAKNQLAGMKQQLGRQRVNYENQTSDIKQKLSEQTMYIDNQTKSLQEQLQAETANVKLIEKVAARTSMMVTYLTRQVAAVNMADFTSRLRESLQNFTKNVLTQEQWRVGRQRILNASLDNEEKISQIQATLMDTAHSVTKLQGRVRGIHQMGERWYKSLQGHVIRLNNTVQDLKENALRLDDVNKDQIMDHSQGDNTHLQDRVDSLHVQLLYNANRLSSLEASMLNLSLTQCRQSSAEVGQVYKILVLNERQEEMRKDLSMVKEKVNAADLNVFKLHSSVKAAEKTIGSLHGNFVSLLSVVPEVQTLQKEMDNVLSIVPQDCHEYFHRGHSESGVYVIHPKTFNRTIRVYCFMEGSSPNSNCYSCSSCKKNRINITHTSTNSAFSQGKDKNNESLSEDSYGNVDKDNTDWKGCGGWTVIQRRTTGVLNFTRSWAEYVEGFGAADDEHWAGNDLIHALTKHKNYELRFVMEDVFSTVWEATYLHFNLSGKEEGYKIHLSGYFGNSTDGMSSCDSSAFSTVDSDNDASSSHCALFNGGGWWYRLCHVTNLNGPYNIGMVWFNNEKQDWIQMKSSLMMLRPKIE